MGRNLAAVALLATIASATGSACAMTSQSKTVIACRVVGGEKLPASSGGVNALCAAVQQAASASAPGVPYEIEIQVASPYAMAARVATSDGRELPEQNMATADRPLSAGSFRRFAQTLAAQLAQAGASR